jgi:hypothetical protein
VPPQPLSVKVKPTSNAVNFKCGPQVDRTGKTSPRYQGNFARNRYTRSIPAF